MRMQKMTFVTFIFFGFLFFSCGNGSEDSSELNSTEANDSLDANDSLVYNNVYGIDISQYQGDEADYLNKNRDSLTFIICKATEGATYTDPDFKNNWLLVQQKGFVKGAYHFYHSSDSPMDQADLFLATIGTLDSTDLPPIVDFEETSVTSKDTNSVVQKNLLEFLEILYQRTGRLPILYVDPSFGNKELTDTAFSKYPLWIADYNNGTEPSLPKLWETNSFTFWQKTDNYELVGDSIKNDFDIFNGNSQKFFEFVQGK